VQTRDVCPHFKSLRRGRRMAYSHTVTPYASSWNELGLREDAKENAALGHRIFLVG